MGKPKELTTDEVRELFIQKVRDTIDYWREVPNVETAERIAGAVFSTLVLLDGGTMDLPQFIVAPDPHFTDKKFQERNGEDWFPENHNSKVVCNIGGCLHEILHK